MTDGNRRESAKGQSAKANERPSGNGVRATGTRTWGGRSAPRGL